MRFLYWRLVKLHQVGSSNQVVPYKISLKVTYLFQSSCNWSINLSRRLTIICRHRGNSPRAILIDHVRCSCESSVCCLRLFLSLILLDFCKRIDKPINFVQLTIRWILSCLEELVTRSATLHDLVWCSHSSLLYHFFLVFFMNFTSDLFPLPCLFYILWLSQKFSKILGLSIWSKFF